MVTDLVALMLAHHALRAYVCLTIFAKILRLLLRMLEAEFIHKTLARVLPVAHLSSNTSLLACGYGRDGVATVNGWTDAAILVRVLFIVNVICNNQKLTS